MSPDARIVALFGLQGRAALITGGTSGIGRMIAQALADFGVTTYITGRDPERTAEAARQIAGEQGICIPLAADIATHAGVTALAAKLAQLQPSLDILVNNAGAQSAAPIDEFSESQWDDVVDLNLKSVFFLTAALLPQLRRAATRDYPARVIQIGSIGGLHVSSIENYAYTAAKAGLHHLTRGLAKRLAADFITVNVLAPGPFPSQMMDKMDDSFIEAVAAQIPLGRMGNASDIAGAVTYLASRAGAYVTGTVIPIDGGFVAGL